ncbi:unnamed protein product, partial [Allacma fusca]
MPITLTTLSNQSTAIAARIKWKPESADKFTDAIEMKLNLSESASITDMNQILTQTINNALSECDMIKKPCITSKPARWFNSDCLILKRELKSKLRKLRSTKSTACFDDYYVKKKQYKEQLTMSKKSYYEALTSRILSSKTSAEFWKSIQAIKPYSCKNLCTITKSQ